MSETVGQRIEAIALQKGLPQHARLAALIGVTYETLRKWREGASAPNRARQAVLVELLGVPAEVFMHGIQAAGTPQVGGEKPPQPHALSLSAVKVVPHLSWGQLMTDDLPGVFRLALVDDSMAPRAGAGQVVTFARTTQAHAGDGVLVADREGNHFFRRYAERRPGHWQAVAENADYQPLDSIIDGLTVQAVLVAVDGPWSGMKPEGV